jgi:hypothetical protein
VRPPAPEGPVSGTRPDASGGPGDTELSITEPSGRNPDTLMSLPRPATQADLPVEARLADLEDRIRGLEARLSSAERMRHSLTGGRATPWWFWLVFLVGLAITWRALELLR